LHDRGVPLIELGPVWPREYPVQSTHQNETRVFEYGEAWNKALRTGD
jgi:hypothetical protein